VGENVNGGRNHFRPHLMRRKGNFHDEIISRKIGPAYPLIPPLKFPLAIVINLERTEN